ncbi:MAG TPA: VWA domain-containing protein, partial [Thermoguttaceae bacterium]|nr:VWA domain-containing protein [Thermoguttaceae bacterium]
ALAEPFRTPQLLAQLTGQRVHRILVLDASLSMGYKREEKSRWEQAKELAAELITRSASGDGFSLILMAEPPQVIVGAPVFDRREMARELEELRL